MNKNARQALIDQAGGVANLPAVADHTVAGDVWSVAVSFLTNEQQIAAMLPPGKHLSIYGPPVVTIAPVYKEVLTGKADIRFMKATWEELPTMVHIVEKLAALEIREVYDATLAAYTGGSMGITKILE
jgi:hypothetical protein